MRRTVMLLLGLIASLGLPGGVATAADKLAIGYTNASANSLDFIAKENGYFDANGLDVDLVSLAGTAVLVPSIVSGAIQVGTAPPPVLVQSAKAGLDLVALTGITELDPGARDSAIVRRPSVAIAVPMDLKGKRIAVSTIGSISQILLEDWLNREGVPPGGVNYVEIPFNQMSNILRQGTIDAALLTEPFLGRAVASGDGVAQFYFMAEEPAGVVATSNIASRAWARSHPDIVARFRKSIAAAERFSNEKPDAAKQIIGKWLKLSPELMRATSLPKAHAGITASDLEWWVNVMRPQGLIDGDVKAGTMIAP